MTPEVLSLLEQLEHVEIVIGQLAFRKTPDPLQRLFLHNGVWDLVPTTPVEARGAWLGNGLIARIKP